MLVTTFLAMIALAGLMGGIAAIRRDQRFLVMMAGVMFLMGGSLLLDPTGLLVKDGSITVTNTTVTETTPSGDETFTQADEVKEFTYSDIDEHVQVAGQPFSTLLGILIMLMALTITMIGVFVPGKIFDQDVMA